MSKTNLLCSFLCLLALLVGCGGGRVAPNSPLGQPTIPPPQSPDAMGLLPPVDALSLVPDRVGSAMLLDRNGSEYEAELAQRVSVEATSARFYPAWVDGSAGFGSLAYAVYGFNVEGYSGIAEVLFEWGDAPDDYTNLWIGLSHWNNNKWDWFPGPSGGALNLEDTGYGDYSKPGTSDMLVAIVILGTEPFLLNVVSVGVTPPIPISITGIAPDPAEGNPGNNISFDVQFNGTEDSSTTFAWDFAGGATPSNPTSKNTTVELGIEGNYDCAITVDNDYGEPDTFSFELTINPSPEPISITGVTPDPAVGYSGVDVAFDVQFTGTVDGTTTYSWNFDGGATPNVPAVKNPTVTLGDPGTYDCSVTVDNNYGDPDSHYFMVNISENQQGDWSMFGHDPQHTRRSPFIGAQTNNLKWSFTTGQFIESSPAISADGTVYVGSHDDKVYAINPDGSLKWDFTTGLDVRSSPAVGADGTVFVGSKDGRLHALNPDGSLRWSYTIGGEVYSSPVIGPDGTVFFGSSDHKLHAINPNGIRKWVFETEGDVRTSPAIGSQGTVYLGQHNLYAINPDGSLKWEYITGSGVQSPAIGEGGVIYAVSFDELHAINPDGSLKWFYTLGNSGNTSPGIGTDGTLYVGCNDGKLYAINADGSLKWTFVTGDNIVSSVAIGADGTLYFGSQDFKFYAINPDGTEKWSYTTGYHVVSSPAIGSDGTVYVGGWDSKLYAFGQ